MPSVPPAPVRFSTSTFWPSGPDMRSPSARAMKSMAPPGASGTMKRTGRFGHPPLCARAPRPASASAAAAALLMKSRRAIRPFSSLPSYGCRRRDSSTRACAAPWRAVFGARCYFNSALVLRRVAPCCREGAVSRARGSKDGGRPGSCRVDLLRYAAPSSLCRFDQPASAAPHHDGRDRVLAAGRSEGARSPWRLGLLHLRPRPAGALAVLSPQAQSYVRASRRQPISRLPESHFNDCASRL